MSKAASSLPIAIYSERNKRQTLIKTEKNRHKSTVIFPLNQSSINHQPRQQFNRQNRSLSKLKKSDSISKLVPLDCSWTFWYDKYIGPGKTVQEYHDALIVVGSFNSVQDFWRYQNHIPITNVKETSSLHLMKSGIRPLWEDSANVEGGNLSFRINKENLQDVWIHIALNIIGEQFSERLEAKDEICGLTMSMRKTEVVISLWNKNALLVDVAKFRAMVQEMIPKVPIANEIYRIHKTNHNFSPR
jgi:translation initiation factor 4E